MPLEKKRQIKSSFYFLITHIIRTPNNETLPHLSHSLDIFSVDYTYLKDQTTLLKRINYLTMKAR